MNRLELRRSVAGRVASASTLRQGNQDRDKPCRGGPGATPGGAKRWGCRRAWARRRARGGRDPAIRSTKPSHRCAGSAVPPSVTEARRLQSHRCHQCCDSGCVGWSLGVVSGKKVGNWRELGLFGKTGNETGRSGGSLQSGLGGGAPALISAATMAAGVQAVARGEGVQARGRGPVRERPCWRGPTDQGHD